MTRVMRLELVKPQQVELPGYVIEVVADASDRVQRLKIRGQGVVLVISSDSIYSHLRLEVPAPPKMVTIYQLRGQVAGLDVYEEHKDEAVAQARMEELAELDQGAGKLEITKLEREEDYEVTR